MMAASSRIFVLSHRNVWITKTVSAQMAKTPATEISIVLTSDGDALDNLMHSLAAELILVRDLRERQTIAAQLRNFIVAIVLGCRAWLERAPVPLGDGGQCRHPLRVELVVLLALPHISDPCAEIDIGALEYFGVVGGY